MKENCKMKVFDLKKMSHEEIVAVVVTPLIAFLVLAIRTTYIIAENLNLEKVGIPSVIVLFTVWGVLCLIYYTWQNFWLMFCRLLHHIIFGKKNKEDKTTLNTGINVPNEDLQANSTSKTVFKDVLLIPELESNVKDTISKYLNGAQNKNITFKLIVEAAIEAEVIKPRPDRGAICTPFQISLDEFSRKRKTELTEEEKKARKTYHDTFVQMKNEYEKSQS